MKTLMSWSSGKDSAWTVHVLRQRGGVELAALLTTVNEAAVPILSARHTHEELHDIPIVDKTALVLMANNELVLDLLEAGEEERARHVVAWMIWAAKAYGVKAVNPGGVAAWKWGKNASALFEPVEGYQRVTPANIVGRLAAMVDELKLPHPLHLHCNNLGVPGNVATTLETMNVLEGRRAHLAHLQFHAYGGDDWSTMRSESARLAEAFNRQTNFTADAGAVLFGDAVTITADGPWQHLLYQLTGHKWGNLDVENETGCGIVPYLYKDRNLVNAVQWAVGLELLLLIDDPWRVFLTTDHPNGAGFWRYPEIIRLLMDAEFRREELKRLPAKARERILLPHDLARGHEVRARGSEPLERAHETGRTVFRGDREHPLQQRQVAVDVSRSHVADLALPFVESDRDDSGFAGGW